MFSGSIVALVTPFKDGKVDYEKLVELVEFHIESGTDAIVPCGTTGESPTLNYEEHDKVIAETVKAARGRLPVIAGTGSNSTEEALRLTKHAVEAGVDGVLLVCPYYNKPTQEGLYQHFMKLAEIDIPQILYNIPSRTGVNLLPTTIARLAKQKNIVAVKEAAGSTDQVQDIMQLTDLVVLSGDDSMTLPFMSVGAQGVISVVANIVPTDVHNMVAAYLDGDTAKARKINHKLYGLSKAMFIETSPVPVKTAMKLLGRLNGEVRLPLVGMLPENEKKVASALKDYGLSAK